MEEVYYSDFLYNYHTMHLCTKNSYHPFIMVAFYLNCLPDDILQIIPRSTRFDWKHRNISDAFGYDWYLQNKDLFHTLQELARSERLIKVNRALLRIIAIKRFMKENFICINAGRSTFKAVLVANIKKAGLVIGLTKALKYLDLNFHQFAKMRAKLPCFSSVFNLCRIKHPVQLLEKEVSVIKRYCQDIRYQYWPLSSLYHKMRRDGAAHMQLSTFYKYVSLLNLKRIKAMSRRKNHHVGIRATYPLQILHADMTEFRTADNQKAYIYLVQDNYSRAILTYQVARERKALYTFQNLVKFKEQYLMPAQIRECMLLTVGGFENYLEVKAVYKPEL